MCYFEECFCELCRRVLLANDFFRIMGAKLRAYKRLPLVRLCVCVSGIELFILLRKENGIHRNHAVFGKTTCNSQISKLTYHKF